MGEDGNEKTESKSESVVFVTTPFSSSFPTPPHHSPLHEGDEPKSPQISSSNFVGQESTLVSHLIPNPIFKHMATSPIVQKVEFESPEAETDTKDSVDRGDVHARVEEDKRLSLIKAWEDNEKTKVENG
ncbi:hypothetical protein Lal_00016695 [Lupinus albus]|nr:hypothetical protein Lal_00016695 [Lupinus albus]